MTDTPGKDAAVATAEKIKAETAAKKEETTMAAVKSSLEMVRGNETLAKLYEKNANEGAQEAAESQLPMLKIHSVGKSSVNELPDGSEPNNGWFFHSKTKQQWQSPLVHVVAISRGFYAEGMEDPKTKEKPIIWNEIMAGVVVNDGKMVPFYFYLTGKKLAPMWEFREEALKYAQAKPLSIPRFALLVKLTTTQEKTSFGKSWVPQFTIVKDEQNNPIVVTDEKLFLRLEAAVPRAKAVMDDIIARTEVQKKAAAVKPRDPEELRPLGEDQNVPYTNEEGEVLPF